MVSFLFPFFIKLLTLPFKALLPLWVSDEFRVIVDLGASLRLILFIVLDVISAKSDSAEVKTN